MTTIQSSPKDARQPTQQHRQQKNQPKAGLFLLRPGERIEYMHRVCPRCGLNLVEQAVNPQANQAETEQVQADAGKLGAARVASDLEVVANGFLQRMVAPLTQAEKEGAQRQEQRWFARQGGQQATSCQQKNGEPRNHQDLIPVLKRKFGQWVFHIRRFFK